MFLYIFIRRRTQIKGEPSLPLLSKIIWHGLSPETYVEEMASEVFVIGGERNLEATTLQGISVRKIQLLIHEMNLTQKGTLKNALTL